MHIAMHQYTGMRSTVMSTAGGANEPKLTASETGIVEGEGDC